MVSTPIKKAPRKNGRPTVFTPEVRQELLRQLRIGIGIKAACKKVGVSYEAFCDYRSRHPKFRERYQAAFEKGLDQLEEQMSEMGRAGNLTAMFGILRANRPGKWRESRSVDISSKDGTLAKLLTASVLHEDALGEPRTITDAKEKVEH